jgi:hypothetical protein
MSFAQYTFLLDYAAHLMLVEYNKQSPPIW